MPLTHNLQEVWNRFLDFEINFGDLDSLKRVDGRIRELYETGDEIGKMKALIDRYRYKDLLPCSTQAAEFYGYMCSLWLFLLKILFRDPRNRDAVDLLRCRQ